MLPHFGMVVKRHKHMRKPAPSRREQNKCCNEHRSLPLGTPFEHPVLCVPWQTTLPGQMIRIETEAVLSKGNAPEHGHMS